MPKTLVCILAETRAGHISWPSFKANVLDALGADLALCVSLPPNYDVQNPFWINARFRWTTEEYDDFGDGFDDVQSRLLPPEQRSDWRAILKVKDQWLGGIKGEGQHPGSAGILIYFRWILFERLVSSGVLDEYDRFVITRSDFLWLCPHPDLEFLSPDAIWIPDGENFGGFTDRHVVLSRGDVETYLSLIRPIITETEATIAAMKSRSNWNLESYIKWHLEQNGVISRVRAFPYVMYSVREAAGKTRWSKGIWNYKNQFYIKYPTEYAAAKFWQHLIKTQSAYADIIDTLNKDRLFYFHLDSYFGKKYILKARLNQYKVIPVLPRKTGKIYHIFPTESPGTLIFLSVDGRGVLLTTFRRIRLKWMTKILSAWGIPRLMGKLLGYQLISLGRVEQS